MTETKLLKQLLLTWILYISQILSLIIFTYIFLAHIIGLFLPTESLFDQKIYTLDYLRFLVFLGLMLGFIAWIISFLSKLVKITSPFSYTINEKICLVLSALFLSIFYNSVFASLKIFQYLIFFSLIAVFFILLPQLIQLYLSFRFEDLKSLIIQTYIFSKKILTRKSSYTLDQIQDFKSLITRTWIFSAKILTRKSSYTLDQIQDFKKEVKDIINNLVIKSFHFFVSLLFTFFSLAVIILSLFFISKIINSYIQGNIYQENLKRRQFFIAKIIPPKAMGSYRVKLEGYHFGSKVDNDSRYRLMTSDGPIRLVGEWTNERLDFTVPLELSTGKKEVWIERPIEDQSNKILKSNVISLEIFSRFTLYPNATDTLYERAIKKIKRFIYFKVPMLSNFMLTQ